MEWRRVATTCGLVLLGASATGIGMGIVLLHARTERDLLNAQVRQTETDLQNLKKEHTRLIEEAASRLTRMEATHAVTTARLEAITQAETLLANASTLPTPDPRTRRTWPETIVVPLGISIRTPVYAPAAVNDQTLTATINGNAQTAGDLWLSVTRYSPDAERSLLNQLQSTTTVQYRIGNRLLAGTRGVFQQNRGIAFVLRIERLGTPEKLIWIRAISPLNEQRLLEILSTLTFAS